MKSIDDLLYDIVNRERNLEINRKEQLETKAQRFATFSGIFISILSTYFFFILGIINFPLFVKGFLIIAICLLGVSLILFLFSMRTLRDETFDLEKLLSTLVKLEFNTALKKVISNLIQYTKIIRGVNNHKAKLLFYGTIFFFSGVISMIIGIFSSIFMI